MSPNDCVLMLAVQLAETTNERDVARQRVAELEAHVAALEAQLEQPKTRAKAK